MNQSIGDGMPEALGGESLDSIVKGTTPIDPGGGDIPVPTDPIGVNKPLLIRIQQIFTGDSGAGEVLVTSAVKDAFTHDAAPYALHGVHKQVQPGRFLTFSATEGGSPIVYYTKASVHSSLRVQTRLSYDRFDEDRYLRYGKLLQKAVALPVFAAGTGLFGPAGALGGGAAVASIGKAVEVVLNMFDRRLDGNDDEDFIANYELNLDVPGLAQARAGWFLMRDDDAGSELMVSPTGRWDGPAEVVDRDDSLFFVDAQGRLCYKDGGRLVDDLDQPFMLLHVSGTETDALDSFAPTAATAALLEKFVETEGDSISDLTDLVTAFNDLTMARRAAAIAEKIEDATGPAKDKLIEQRKAVIKQVQDDDIRDLIPSG